MAGTGRNVCSGIFLAASLLGAGRAKAAPEIVVAMRYLLPDRTSHAHLYLYREDGRLLRQLTADDSGQDWDPIFAPDGETIVYTREKLRRAPEFWSVRPRGGGLRRLAKAPDWYRRAPAPLYFTSLDAISSAAGDQAPRIAAPDGSVELVLRESAKDEEDFGDGPGHGQHYLLRDLKTRRETEMAKLPGFVGLYELLHLKQNAKQHFLFEGPLRLAFFGLHLNSTDGDTTFALDLTKRRLVRLSPNGAAPFPLPGQPAFLTMTYVRYVPIAGSRKTANCSYLERWDAKLNKVRYARPSAAICYGASLWRGTGKTVTIRMLGQ